MTERVLITGATGFVGMAVARALRSRGHELLCPVRQHGARASELEALGATVWAPHNFSTEELVRTCPDPPSVVVHLAASGVAPNERSPDALVHGHELLTIHVLQAAAAWAPRLVLHTGSWSECAVPADGTITVETPIAPTSAYGIAKASATRWAQQLADEHSLLLKTLRLFNVYGPGERLPRLLPTLLSAVRSREVPSLTSGRAVRDFVFVGDVAEAYARVIALDEPATLPGLIQICTGEGASVQSVTEQVAARCAAPWLLEGLGARPDRPDEPPRVVGSLAEWPAALQWRPAVSLAQGLAETITTEGPAHG